MMDEVKTPEEAEEVRLALVALKNSSGMSWRQLAQKSGIAEGTISGFGVGSYAGDVLGVAEKARRFLSGRAALALLKPGEVRDPGYLATPTSAQMLTLLQWAQSGEIVAIAAGPGTGKSVTLAEY